MTKIVISFKEWLKPDNKWQPQGQKNVIYSISYVLYTIWVLVGRKVYGHKDKKLSPSLNRS